MIRAPSNWARGMCGIEGKACDRQSAAALLRLVDGAGKVASKAAGVSRPVRASIRPSAIDGVQRAAQMRLEGVLADQRQRRRDHLGGDRRETISRFGRS